MRSEGSSAPAPISPDTTFEGRRPSRAVAGKALLPLDPNHLFTLLHHPGSWDVAEVDDRPVLVPRLRRFTHEPGVLGVEQVRGSHNGDPDKAMVGMAKHGFVSIDPDIEVTAWGKTSRGYAVEYDGRRGLVYLTAWERPYVMGSQVIIDHDDEGYDRWRAALVGKVIAPPDRVVLRALRLQMERAMHARQSRDRSPGAYARAEVYERRLQVFEGGKGSLDGAAVEGRQARRSPTSTTPKE